MNVLAAMKKKSIKRGAHTATFLAACWTLFSTFAIFDWFDMRRHLRDPNAAFNLGIWGVHLLLIMAAIYYWKHEKEQETLWIGEDDEIMEEVFEVKPEDINLEQEKADLKRGIIAQVISTVGLIGFSWAMTFISPPKTDITQPGQDTQWMAGVALFFGGFMLLSVLFSLLRYFILWYRARNVKREQS